MELRETVKLNGQEVTKEQLEQARREAEQTKGKKIVETAPGEYRTKLED